MKLEIKLNKEPNYDVFDLILAYIYAFEIVILLGIMLWDKDILFSFFLFLLLAVPYFVLDYLTRIKIKRLKK